LRQRRSSVDGQRASVNTLDSSIDNARTFTRRRFWKRLRPSHHHLLPVYDCQKQNLIQSGSILCDISPSAPTVRRPPHERRGAAHDVSRPHGLFLKELTDQLQLTQPPSALGLCLVDFRAWEHHPAERDL